MFSQNMYYMNQYINTTFLIIVVFFLQVHWTFNGLEIYQRFKQLKHLKRNFDHRIGLNRIRLMTYHVHPR